MFITRRVTHPFLVLSFLQALLSLGPPAPQDPGHVYDPAHDLEAKFPWKGDPYLLSLDPVSCTNLGPVEQQIIVQREGRELRFASKENADAFSADPERYLVLIDQHLVRQQRQYYPIEVCVISGMRLGKLGEPYDFIYRNRLVRLSSRDGVQTFLQNPAKYIKELDREVIAKQLPDYPLEHCVVSGEALGAKGQPVDLVFGNRLVRFCCKDCPEEFRKDPLRYFDKLDHALHGQARPRSCSG